MGLVTNVYWNCPGCGSREQAQTDGKWEDPGEFSPSAIPSDRHLKSAPPCTKCGKYRLVLPVVPLTCEIKEVPEGAPKYR